MSAGRPCYKKTRYPDKLAAMIALARTSSPSGKKHRRERRYYRCPDCGGFHLTSKR